jgi:hypothetical protein
VHLLEELGNKKKKNPDWHPVLVEVMVFYKFDYASLIETKWEATTFLPLESFVAY